MRDIPLKANIVVRNVHNCFSNKLLLTVLCSICYLTCFSQQYISLDSLNAKYPVKPYTLNTKELYGIDKEVQVYNVFTSSDKILLISVLPDLEERVLPLQDPRGKLWRPVQTADFEDKVLSNANIDKLAFDLLQDYEARGKTVWFRLLKKQGDQHYVAKTTLVEVFTTRALPAPFVNTYGNLNTLEPSVGLRSLVDAFKKTFPGQQMIMDPTIGSIGRNLALPYQFRQYLSRQYDIGGEKAYQFWTFDGWWATDGLNQHRGIDRLVYIPGKGIVGGSYDFWFAYQNKFGNFRLPRSLIWQNALEEKIMLAKELKK